MGAWQHDNSGSGIKTDAALTGTLLRMLIVLPLTLFRWFRFPFLHLIGAGSFFPLPLVVALGAPHLSAASSPAGRCTAVRTSLHLAAVNHFIKRVYTMVVTAATSQFSQLVNYLSHTFIIYSVNLVN